MLKITKNKIFGFILSGIILIVVSGCKKDKDSTPVNQNGTVYFVFENYVDADPIQMGQLIYSNDAGNPYSVDLLKYYISNITFTGTDNALNNTSNYNLIDESLPSSKMFSVSLPKGSYKKLSFLMGVDSIKNVSGAQSGALDPSYGMFWDWNTGYIYFKHEGSFIETNNDTLPIVYHYGTLDALRMHTFNESISVSDVPLIIKIRFNLNKLYNQPNQVNFHNNNIHSGGANFINTLRENFDGAFEVIAIQ